VQTSKNNRFLIYNAFLPQNPTQKIQFQKFQPQMRSISEGIFVGIRGTVVDGFCIYFSEKYTFFINFPLFPNFCPKIDVIPMDSRNLSIYIIN